MMTITSLFTGIGGFDLAFQRAGFDLSWFCEIEAFPREVLAKHWPAVPCYENVCAVNGATVAPVDVLCAGVPCQDVSVAGKRRGVTPAYISPQVERELETKAARAEARKRRGPADVVEMKTKRMA